LYDKHVHAYLNITCKQPFCFLNTHWK